MKKLIVFISIICILLSIGIISNAESSISLSKVKDSILPGEPVSITVTYPDNISVADYTLTFDGNAFLADISQISGYVKEQDSGSIKVVDTKNKSLKITLKSKPNANGTYSFGLTNVNIIDANGEGIPVTSSGIDVIVRAKSSDATLASLKVNGVALDVNKLEHKIAVPYNATKVTILAEKALYGKEDVPDTGSKDLTGKESTFEILSTAEDGTTKIYKIVVIKTDPINSKLDSLSVNGKTCDINVLKHSLTCDNGTDKVVILTVGKDKKINAQAISGASLKLTKDVSNGKEYTFALKDGLNQISLTSRASDGNYTNYSIYITREKYQTSADATLKAIYVDGVLIERI